MKPFFTPEDLADMAAADAEIEATFCLTNEDIIRSREIDKAAMLDRLPPEKKKKSAYSRAYREANREKIASKNRAYRESHREELAAKARAYYDANREKIMAKQKAYRESHREELAAKARAYREAKREGNHVSIPQPHQAADQAR